MKKSELKILIKECLVEESVKAQSIRLTYAGDIKDAE